MFVSTAIINSNRSGVNEIRRVTQSVRRPVQTKFLDKPAKTTASVAE